MASEKRIVSTPSGSSAVSRIDPLSTARTSCLAAVPDVVITRMRVKTDGGAAMLAKNVTVHCPVDVLAGTTPARDAVAAVEGRAFEPARVLSDANVNPVTRSGDTPGTGEYALVAPASSSIGQYARSEAADVTRRRSVDWSGERRLSMRRRIPDASIDTQASLPPSVHCGGHVETSPTNRPPPSTCTRSSVLRPIFPYSDDTGLSGEYFADRFDSVSRHDPGSGRPDSARRPRVIWIRSSWRTSEVMFCHAPSYQSSTVKESGV
ncbi:hypothetical protein [Streptomyces sp. NPDC055006]